MSRNRALGIFTLLTILVVCGLLPPAREPVQASPSTTVYSVGIEAVRPGGGVALLRFEIVAVDAPAALAVATQSLLMAGFEAARPGVRAQWLPWSWKWDAAEIPVPVAYNPGGAPGAVSPAMVLAGLQAWSDVPGSSFAFQYAGITNNTASILDLGPDGENVISWAALPCQQGCVLGITSKESAHEVDMLLNSNPEAAAQLGVGSTVDWRTVILHELGHIAGLEHSCPVPFGPCTDAEADAVMYFQYRGTLRKLAPDDVAGMVALYPAQVGSPTPQPTLSPGVTPTPTPFPELPVLLEKGWNLVVLPPGPVGAATDVLTCVLAAYSFEGEEWRTWIRGAPAGLQELTAFEDGRAYWLFAGSFCAHVFP